MKPFFRTALLLGIATLVFAEAQEAYAQEQSGGQHHSTFVAKLEEIMSRPEFIHSEFGIALYDQGLGTTARLCYLCESSPTSS